MRLPILATTVMIAFFCSGADFHPPNPPVLQPFASLGQVDFDSNGVFEFEYSFAGGGDDDPEAEFLTYYIGFGGAAIFPASLLMSTRVRIVFEAGEPISLSTPEYLTAQGERLISFGIYGEHRSCRGCDWQYFDPRPLVANFWRHRTEFYLGVRFRMEDGLHHGWVQFSRPDTGLTTGFSLVAHDWNPLPGEPIEAGRPPVIPVHPEVTAEGTLRLSWSPAVATWQLEFTDRLAPDAAWVPVPEAGGTEAVVALPEAQRFFRLRRQ